jgi:Predicted membrane protein
LDVSRAISYSLIIGVLVSASLMAAGSAMLFARGGGDGYALSQLASPSSPVNSGTMGIREVLAGLASLDGVSLIFLGSWSS